MIVILDYGIGNVRSIANMLTKVGAENVISSSLDDVRNASKLILPGVGAFDTAISTFRASGLLDAVEQRVAAGTPILGICVGFQMFAKHSEEGKCPGLGWLDAEVLRFVPDNERDIRVPHMGWNTVELQKDHPISRGLQDDVGDTRFYFTHSYYFQCNHDADILMTCDHGLKFTAAAAQNQFIGVQFHPEKSHRYGMRFFSNFAKLATPDIAVPDARVSGAS